MSNAVAKPTNGLTEREAKLVEVIIQAASEGRSITREQAGTAAGYEAGDGARVSAHRALKRPDVRKALMEGLRECAQVDAADAYAVLRHLASAGRSERVRADVALNLARMGGLDAPQGFGGGGGVAVQIVFRTDVGTLLTQPVVGHTQPIDVAYQSAPTHAPVEGMERADEADTPPPPPSPARAKATPRGSKTARVLPPTGQPRNSPPKNSGVRKARGKKADV